ncbi:MAG: tyrosine-type recombinase/integrase [Caulobacteraceae bacterium]
MNVVSAQGLTPAANLDEAMLRMWLHGKQPNTALAYEADARRFLAFSGKSIAETTLADLQAWDVSMSGFSQASRARRVAAVKSLLTFHVRSGLLTLNAGVAMRVEKPQSTKAERILTEQEVARMIGREDDPRRRAALRVLDVMGLRASEVVELRWRDLTGTDKKGGEARVLGKGSKARKVVVPAALWRELAALTPAINADAPVVPGRDGGQLDRKALFRIVKRAARRAGINGDASPHWLRHSHCSHALDNGCPPHVLQATVGHASMATTTTYAHIKAGESSASFIKG